MRTAILRLLQFLGKSRSNVFLKEKIFWQKSLKWISEGIHFLERKVISYRSCSFFHVNNRFCKCHNKYFPCSYITNRYLFNPI